MTGPDPNRLLSAYLEEGPTVLPDRSVELILGEVARTRRRRRGLKAVGMPRLAFAAAAAVVAVVIVGGLVLLAGRFRPLVDIGNGTPAPSSSPGTIVNPPASAFRDYILFTRRLPSEPEARLFAVAPDGSGLEQLRPEDVCCFALDPGGSYLILGITSGTRLTIGEVSLVDASVFGNVPNDGRTYPPGLNMYPRSASTRLDIAFQTNDGIWMSRDNAGRFAYGTFEKLATGSGPADIPVAFSPDGADLLFVRQALAPAGYGDLLVVDRAGGVATQLNPPDVHLPISDPFFAGASWSPDGRRVAYVGHSDQDNISRIYVVGINGGDLGIEPGEPVTITPPGVGTTGARWSPRDNRILFDRVGADGSRHLFVVNPDRYGEREITGGLHGPCCAVWSPDASHVLVLVGGTDAQHTDLWIVGADGNGARRLTYDPGEYTNQVWVPSSR